MGISHLHVVHKHPKRQPEPAPEPAPETIELEQRDDSGCPNNFYTSPTMSSTIDSLQPLAISWNPACLPSTTTLIDIYLSTAAGDLTSTSNTSRLHIWSGVTSSKGTYEAELMPRWWGATSSQQLQVSIVPSGMPVFMATLPGGPIFTATYTAPTNSGSGTPAAADTSVVDSPVTQVGGLATNSGGLSGGKKAAAVIMPLLFIGLCIAAYIKMKRSRNQDKRKKWTEAVDKRMSTISTDWKSVSGAGANAAIRNSIAVGVVGNRNSSFSFGALRPSSTLAVESDDSNNNEKRPAAQLRTGVGLRNPAGLTSTTSVDRVSRVSFAPDTRVSRVSFADSTNTGRPSGESRRTRAFHSAYIPPVPALPEHAMNENEKEEADIADEDEGDDEEERSDENGTAASFSPRQAQGALTLTPEDIRSRIVAGRARAASNAQQQQYTGHHQQHQYPDEKSPSNFDDYMPALAMMRTGSNTNDPSHPENGDADDFLFAATAPVSPVSPPPAYPKALGSVPSQVPYSIGYPQLQTQGQGQMQSPVMSSMPMQPMPANVMSPDEMLRAYAERKKMLAASASGAGASVGSKPVISYPVPVANTSETNMRVLYNAATANTGGGNTESQYSIGTDSSSFVYNPPYHQNALASHNSNNGSNGNGGQYPFGHHPNGSIGVGRYGGARYSIGGDVDEEGDAYDVHGYSQGQGRAA